MNQRQKARKLMIFGIGIIIAVLVIGFVVSNHAGGTANAGSPSSSLVPEVVALQTVPEGRVFKSGDSFKSYFGVRQAPANLVPFGTYNDVNQISLLTNTPGCGSVHAAGCQGEVTTTQTIFQNTPVVSGMFSTLGEYRTGPGPAFTVPYGYVAEAVNLTSDNDVLGSVMAGDDVDLMASYHPATNPAPAPGQTQYVLNDVRVLSVNAPPPVPGGTSPSSSSSSSTQNNSGGLILLLSYQQALEVQHLKDFGWTLSVALRSAKETDIKHFRTIPVTDRWFFRDGSNHFTTSFGL